MVAPLGRIVYIILSGGATMTAITETKLLTRFIDKAKKRFGSRIWIERQVSDIRIGVPDVYVLIDGLFLPMEAKYSFEGKDSILSHKFKKVQIEKLKYFTQVGGYGLGIIFREEEVRTVFPNDIREDGQMSLSQYLALPLFSWEKIIHDGQNHQLHVRR